MAPWTFGRDKEGRTYLNMGSGKRYFDEVHIGFHSTSTGKHIPDNDYWLSNEVALVYDSKECWDRLIALLSPSSPSDTH